MYSYRVSAVNAYGEGPLSQEVSAAPDGTPPVTNASVSGRLGNEGWWLSTVTIKLTASDDNSGVASTSYRVDGGDWQTYALPVWVSGTGNHTVDFYSTDNAGNVEGWHSVGFRIDSTAPLTTITLDGAAGDDYWFHSIVTVDIAATDAGSGVDSIQYRLDGGTWATYSAPFDFAEGASLPRPAASGWYTSPIPVTITASDALSGVASIFYRIDGGAWQTYTGSFLLTPEGDHTLEYVAVDAAGNRGLTQSTFVRTDTTAPVVSAPPARLVTTSQVTLSWTGTDAGSGIDHYEVRVDGGTFESVGNERSVSLQLVDGSHTIVIRAIDRAGNEASTVVTVRVDTSPLSASGPYGATLDYAIILAVTAVGIAVAFVVIRRRRRVV